MTNPDPRDVLLDHEQTNAERIEAMRVLVNQGEGVGALVDLYLYEHMRMILWDVQEVIEEAAILAQLDNPDVQAAVIKHISGDPHTTLAFIIMLGRAGQRFERITPYHVELLIGLLEVRPNPIQQLKGILRADFVRVLMGAFSDICITQSDIVLQYFDDLNDFAHDEAQPEDLRWVAAFAVGETGHTETSDVLIDYLLDGRYGQLRVIGAHTLSKNNVLTAQPAMLEIVQNDRNKYLREGVSSALVDIANEQAVSALLDMLENDSDKIKGNAARALARIGEQTSAFWREHVASENSTISQAAIAALAGNGDGEARAILMGALAQGIAGSAWALGKLHEEPAVDYLARALLTTDDDDEHKRCEMAWALRQFDSDEAHDALEHLLDDDFQRVRLHAALGLASVDRERSERLLVAEIQRGLPVGHKISAWSEDVEQRQRGEVIALLQASESIDVQEVVSAYLRKFER